MKRVLSGIRATGRLHIGNYLGAVKGMLELQNDPNYECFYMVADLHAITTPYKVSELQINRREVVLDYLACGLDPDKVTLFQQADVVEHAELSFYLSSVMTVSRMQFIPTFKEKAKQYPEHITMALLNYPILMAADIMLYKANLVPVGIDQEPHLEVTREVVRKMNAQYDLSFPEPTRFATKGQYVPSLSGEGKMGKSVAGSYIQLADTLDEIRKKVRGVPTATQAGGEMTGGLKTLFTLLDLFAPSETARFTDVYKRGSLQFVELKDFLAETIYENLKPIQKKRKQLENDQTYIDSVLKTGKEKATQVSLQTVQEVKKAMGLG